MAQKYIVQLVDDLTNDTIEDGAGESVHFALDGVSYTIDLSAKNADDLRSTFNQYVSAARKADGVTSAKTRSTPRLSSAPKTDLKDVRDWASKNGFEVSSRGRIPGNVQEAYAAAH